MSVSPQTGKRHDDDLRSRDAFLASGKIPLGLALRKGLWSLLTDPWKSMVLQMTGPLGFVLRQRYYRRRLGQMGRGVVIDPQVSISHPENIYLDDFAYLGRNLSLVSPEGYIKIGKRCHINGWILGHNGVEIGDYVGSSAIILSATDSHKGGHRMAGPMLPPEQRAVQGGKVVIGRDAFLGQYSIIMPRVTIGEGAIVAPLSLVVSSVKPWTIVMGVPAKVVGTREKVTLPDPD